jgi:geranylgeranyl diphosphate synthase type I
MTSRPTIDRHLLDSARIRVDAVLLDYLQRSRADVGDRAPEAEILVREIERLVLAGGKRLRPAFCIWGYEAALHPASPAAERGAGEPIVRVGASLELLHTMALIHDDLMDGADRRRGVAASSPHLAAWARSAGPTFDPARFGGAAALLAGDLAAVLADRLFLTSGFAPDALARALAPYHEMRLDMAAGQMAGLGAPIQVDEALRVARLKGGSYTVEGPLIVGAALAGDRADVRDALAAFGRPLGEAFQLRDDLMDHEPAPGITAATVNDLVARARESLRSAPLEPNAAAVLDELAATVAIP